MTHSGLEQKQKRWPLRIKESFVPVPDDNTTLPASIAIADCEAFLFELFLTSQHDLASRYKSDSHSEVQTSVKDGLAP